MIRSIQHMCLLQRPVADALEDKADDNVEQEHCTKPQQNLTEWTLTVMKSRLNFFLSCVFVSLLLLLMNLMSFMGLEAAPAAQSGRDCQPPAALIIGSFAQVTNGVSNNVRNSPSLEGELLGRIPGGSLVTVLEGPICASGYQWWNVRYQDLSGWTVDGADGEYYLISLLTAAPTAAPVVRSISQIDFPLPVEHPINPDQLVRVITKATAIRAEARDDAEIIGTAYFGETLTVIGHGVESNGRIMWKVYQKGGIEGWIVETVLDESNQWEETHKPVVLPQCPYDTDSERMSFVVHPYVYTAAPDGSLRCAIAYLDTSPFYTTWDALTYGVNRTFWSSRGDALLFIDGIPGANTYYELNMVTTTGSAQIVVTPEQDVEWAAWSPDGLRIAAVMNGEAWVMDRHGIDRLQLSAPGERVEYVAWSPDNKTVLYLEAIPDNPDAVQVFTRTTYVLHSVGDEGSRPRELMWIEGDQQLRDIDLSPDGRFIIMVVNTLDESESPAELYTTVVELATREEKLRIPQWAEWSWSPDWKKLALYNIDEPRIVSLDSFETTPLPDFEAGVWSPDSTKLYQTVPPGFQVYDLATGQITQYLEAETAHLDPMSGKHLRAIAFP